MKKLLFFILTLLTTPLFASPDCMDNSEHLKKAYDNKEWHSIECYCKCEKIKNGFCPVCGHLQEARPITIVEPTKASSNNTQQSMIQLPKNLQDFVNNRVRPYLRSR